MCILNVTGNKTKIQKEKSIYKIGTVLRESFHVCL